MSGTKTRNDLLRATDKVILMGHLKMIIDEDDRWEGDVIRDDGVFTKHPRALEDSEGPIFVVHRSRTEACGKTDGCESGCWRIIGRDKLVHWEIDDDDDKTVKSERREHYVGFKKILKFCEKTERREYKRSWVMEEFRVRSKWNWKQDHVFCKIRLLFQAEMASLLAKYYTCLEAASSVPIPGETLLPEYGIYFGDQREGDAYYLQTIADSGGDKWPSYVTTDVFGVDPFTLVDLEDAKFLHYGICFYVNRTEVSGSGRTDDGYWRIKGPVTMIKDQAGKVLGLKRTFEFCGDEESEGVWEMEEYSIGKKTHKLLCLIKVSQ